ncbi:hypothetical protein R5R35_006865 [Gryllus longicercus]|uniref:Uncharacterized protein n=1 Tax=Gryllus longicercus TaxID=2509291 RepID=A0AAN9Z9M6_9ORTH
MVGRTHKLGTSRIKRRKVIKDEMPYEDERNITTSEEDMPSEDENIISLSIRRQLYEQRKPAWEALFKKYELKSTHKINSEDCISDMSLISESLGSKEREYKSIRPTLKLKKWQEFNPSSPSSKDNSEQPTEVDKAAEKNEDIGTIEDSVTNESPARKSNPKGHLLSRVPNIGKKDKKMSVSKNISQNLYQMRSRKKKDGNFEKTGDVSQSILSNGIIKKSQKRSCENRTYEKTNIGKLCQHESSKVNHTRNKQDNMTCFDTEVHFEKQSPVKTGLINSAGHSKHIPEEKWQEFNPSSPSSKDNSEQPTEVDKAAKKNEDIGTIEDSVTNESPARKSNPKGHLLSRVPNIGKKDKKMSVSKDISQNLYQMRSRKKKDGNFEKTGDVSQSIISNGIIKKSQKRSCENRTYEKTNIGKLCQHESSKVNHTRNKQDNMTCFDTEVHFEKQSPVKMGLINSAGHSKHIPEEKKNYCNENLKFLSAKNLGNISQNSPSKKIGIACKVYKTKQETYKNIVHDSEIQKRILNTDLMNTDSRRHYDFSSQSEENFEKRGQKNDQNKSIAFSEENKRAISEWRTEFSNFIKYKWNDFEKNPGSMLFPLPRLKRSNLDEKLSWESIMNAN